MKRLVASLFLSSVAACLGLPPEDTLKFACEGATCPDAGEDVAPSCNVSCPPAPARCRDSKTLLRTRMSGCSGSRCQYEAVEATCAIACEDGACVDEPCAGRVCSMPPERTCLDNQTMRTWEADGRCDETGACRYRTVDLHCASGCQAGACVGEPCLGKVCTMPPASKCLDEVTLGKVWPTGVCNPVNGGCSYAYNAVPCPGGCLDGECVGDLCAARSCPTPVSTCASSTEQRTFSQGTCVAGVCSFASIVTPCESGAACVLGRCDVPDAGVDAGAVGGGAAGGESAGGTAGGALVAGGSAGGVAEGGGAAGGGTSVGGGSAGGQAGGGGGGGASGGAAGGRAGGSAGGAAGGRAGGSAGGAAGGRAGGSAGGAAGGRAGGSAGGASGGRAGGSAGGTAGGRAGGTAGGQANTCSSELTCGSCTQEAGCGWCDGACRSGSAAGPSVGTCGGRWSWLVSDCSGGGGGSAGGSAGGGVGGGAAGGAPSCQAATCNACTGLIDCGWCNGSCRAGTLSGSTDGVCTATQGTWKWVTTSCAPTAGGSAGGGGAGGGTGGGGTTLPGGETCGTATPLVITNGQAVIQGSTAGFVSNRDDSCGSTAADVYYAFTLTQPQAVTVTVTPSGSWSPSVSLLSGCGGEASVCSWESSRTSASTSVRSLGPGTYTVVVDGRHASSRGAFTLRVQTGPPLPFDADSCTNPTLLDLSTGRAIVSGTTAGFRDDTSDCGSLAPDVVYSFTLTQPARIVASIETSGWSASLQLVSGCSAAEVAPCEASSDDRLRIEARSLPAGTYSVIVDGYIQSEAGDFTLSVERSAPLPLTGDTCTTAVPIALASGTTTLTGTTTGFRNDRSSGSCGSEGSDVFYSFTLPAPSRVSARLTTPGWYGAVSLVQGCSTTEVGVCQDTLQSGSAVLEVNELAAGAYSLVIDGYIPSEDGPFTIEFTLTP